jgi:hypothetical protein
LFVIFQYLQEKITRKPAIVAANNEPEA